MNLAEQQMAISATAGVGGWLSQANEYLQFGAFVVAILSGLIGLYSFAKRKWDEYKRGKRDGSEGTG